MRKFYYALWIPVLQKTCFEIIGNPKSKTLQDSKEFSRYTIKGEMEKNTLHFSLRYKEGKKKVEKCLRFQCEEKSTTGFLIYSIELDDSLDGSLEERLRSKMPTFIYHYVKDFFHKHVHHDPSHDSLLHAYFSKEPLSFKNHADRAAIMMHYASYYQQKFIAYTTSAQSVYATAKQNINSRLSINKGIRQLEFLLNEGREILGETEFCCALMEMEAGNIPKNVRRNIYELKQQIEDLQQHISFSYNLCTSSYGIKLGYWGIWFGGMGILVSAVSIYLTLYSSPDYSIVINRMDSIEKGRKIQVDSLIKTEQKKMNLRLDSIDRRLEKIHIQLNKKPVKNKEGRKK